MAISGLVRNWISSGTSAFSRRSASSAHSLGRYRRYPIGRLELHVDTDRLTATRQFSCLPSCPQYWCATPTECFPFFGKPVSSTIHATTGPCFCMVGSRTGAVLRRFNLSCCSPFPLGVPH